MHALQQEHDSNKTTVFDFISLLLLNRQSKKNMQHCGDPIITSF
jgi:hypothetical protein